MNAKEFPLSNQADNAFNSVKKELEVASLNPIDEPCPLLLSVMHLSPQYLPLSTKLEDQLRSCQEESKAVNYTTPQ